MMYWNPMDTGDLTVAGVLWTPANSKSRVSVRWTPAINRSPVFRKTCDE